MIKDMIEATDFRDAMALLPTAVNVITTNGPSGTHGFTARRYVASLIHRRHCWCMNCRALTWAFCG